MTDHSAWQAALLNVWERGEPQGSGGRALSLLDVVRPDNGSDPGELAVGCRDALLLDLRERLFGRRFTGLTTCPMCGEEIELTFDVSEVRRGLPRANGGSVRTESLDVRFRLPNSADILAIESAPDVPTARGALVQRCIEALSSDGAPISVDELSAAALEAAIAEMRELDPQADVTLDVDCPSCAHGWREPFDIVTFLWTELSAWARRVLGEVHAIASAYGWSECEILGLTPARRHAYLEMLQ